MYLKEITLNFRVLAGACIGMAVVTTAAPLTGAICAPWLGGIVAEYGWRAALCGAGLHLR